MLFFIFSNFQTIYFLAKVFPALQVRFRRKLLKKGKKYLIHTTQINWKTVPHLVSILHFYIYFKNYKKIHLKRLPFSSFEELTRKHGVLKLTNIMGNKSIPKFSKLNPMSVCQGAGKFRFFQSKSIPSNTLKIKKNPIISYDNIK